MVLGDDTVKVIWGWHPDRPTSKTRMHRHRHKGVRSLHLKEEAGSSSRKFSSSDKFKHWDIRADNVRLPNDDHTHYFCQIFKAGFIFVQHLRGFRPVLAFGNLLTL